MGKYAATMSAAAGTDDTFIGDVSEAAAGPRLGIYDFILGSDGTPADTGFRWRVMRSSAHGTRGGAVTPTPLDSADSASSADAGEGTYTIDPTDTAGTEMLDMPLNLRATWRWVCAPGGELIAPATDNNGFVWLCGHASATDNQRVTAHFWE